MVPSASPRARPRDFLTAPLVSLASVWGTLASDHPTGMRAAMGLCHGGEFGEIYFFVSLALWCVSQQDLCFCSLSHSN